MSSKKSGGISGKKSKNPQKYLRLVKPKPFGQAPDAPSLPAESAPPAAAAADELIETSDFQSVRLSITLLASRSTADEGRGRESPQIFGSTPKLRTGSKAQVVGQISLNELLDNGVVLDVPPPDFYQEGQVVYVLVKATRPGGEEERTFSSNARVEAISTGEDGALSVRLAFLKPDPQQWQEFRSLFTDRQREINEFLAAARGR